MQIETLEKTDSKALFHLKDSSLGMANAIRRTITSSLPSLAIDEVDVYENNSALFNEYIANRIGLVPLTWEDGVDDDAKIAFTLNAEGPCTVYSRDLKSTDEKIKVFAEHIPIMKLDSDQRLRLEGVAVKGTGKKHAKFQNALASYNYFPEFKVSGECNKCGACVEACPRGAISKDVKLVGTGKCDLCGACQESCGKKALKVKWKEGDFVFFVESYNNVPAAECFKKAVQMLDEKAEELSKDKLLK